MGFKEIKVQEEVSANLIPMIDIMFLLLLFFMLNADMSVRELESVTPAVAKSAQEMKGDTTDMVTINVHHIDADTTTCAAYTSGQVCRTDGHWAISVGGQRYAFTERELGNLEKVLRELANTRRADTSNPNSFSERPVIIRADRTAPYGYIQQAMMVAARARLWKIQVGVWKPKSEANKQ